MKPEPMSFERFQQLLDAYGADFDRWPEAERQAGRKLVLAAESAQSARQLTAQLDAFLDRAPVVEPSESLRNRVASIPERHDLGWWPFRSRIKPALAWVAALLLGIAAGTTDLLGSETTAQPEPSTPGAVDAPKEALTDQDIEDLSALAFATHMETDQW